VSARTGRIRLGLAGVGRWGANYVRTIAAGAEAELVAVSSRNPNVPVLVGAGCRVHASWEGLLDSSEIDALIVATPASTHYEIASAALSRGLPVLVEKPLATRLEDARGLEGLAAERDLPLITDHVYLFHPGFRALLERLDGTEIVEITALAGNAGPLRDDVSVLWDWGPHDVAMCLEAMRGLPTACGVRIEREAGRAQSILVDLDFGGRPARLHLGNDLPARRRTFEVRTSSETIVFEDAPERGLTVTPHRGRPRSVAFSPEPPLAIAVHEFVEAVRAGRATPRAARLGVEVVAVLDACQRSL